MESPLGRLRVGEREVLRNRELVVEFDREEVPETHQQRLHVLRSNLCREVPDLDHVGGSAVQPDAPKGGGGRTRCSPSFEPASQISQKALWGPIDGSAWPRRNVGAHVSHAFVTRVPISGRVGNRAGVGDERLGLLLEVGLFVCGLCWGRAPRRLGPLARVSQRCVEVVSPPRRGVAVEPCTPLRSSLPPNRYHGLGWALRACDGARADELSRDYRALRT